MNRLEEIIYSDAQKICQKVDLSPLENKTILITGASGLIGVNILACLKYFSSVCRKKFRLIAVIKSRPIPYLEKLLDFSGATVLQGDLTDYDFCKGLPQADFIIHAAGYGQPRRFLEDPVKTLKLNTSTLFLLLEKLSPEGKFLFLSTSEVYSGLVKLPHREEEIGTTNTTHPRAAYIEAKRCGEAICHAHRLNGTDIKVARICLAYGPGTKPADSRALNNFIYKGLNGKIELLDQGTVVRSYCYITDTVEILCHILFYGKDFIYNVGGVSRVTIADLARQIGACLNVPVISPDRANKQEGAPDEVSLDMTKVQREFQKNEYVSLDEGLKKTIEWQRQLYNITKESLRAQND